MIFILLIFQKTKSMRSLPAFGVLGIWSKKAAASPGEIPYRLRGIFKEIKITIRCKQRKPRRSEESIIFGNNIHWLKAFRYIKAPSLKKQPIISATNEGRK